MNYNSNTYLGSRGYTINKNNISISEQNKIKKELWIKPYVAQGEQPEFPAFRESAKNLYVPRFYGNKRLGIPATSQLKQGDDIDVPFNGNLRENQVPVVDAYLNTVLRKDVNDGKDGGLLELPCAYGKCLGKDTPIIMLDGNIKLVQDIVCGDLLMGDDSTPRTVLSLSRGREKMYKIANADCNTDFFICNESHILSLKDNKGQKVDISVKDYLQLPLNDQRKHKGYKVALQFPEIHIPYNPFIYGSFIFSNHDQQNMKIDPVILFNSEENRLHFLKGILHSVSGSIQASQFVIQINNVNPVVVHQLQFLLSSLGYCYELNDEKITVLEAYEQTDRIEKCCLKKTDLTHSLHLTELEEDFYYGFEIDGNRRFVLGNFTVTHNTVLALKIISEMKKKVILIVHKSFLVDQWTDEIHRFLPTARIGRIQGDIVDIDNKDIVIGMLQSISKKTYDNDTFQSFGLTIIDEVHHISSISFSKLLFKIVTKYTLGLSATMTRKDGTTPVIKMFLGDVIYKGSNTVQRNISVRAMFYRSNDEEFKEIVMDYRGKVQYSSMIKKLCEYNRRSEFILQLVVDLLKEKSNQQVMILSQNRNILKYFFKAIQHRNIGTVGYYVGGMKESELKLTETKQIILGTYAMSSEGLNIKTITALIFATPKSDIEQSEGRNRSSEGVLYDIIDEHYLFLNQWKKHRKPFYMNLNYNIEYCSSDEYHSSYFATKQNQNNTFLENDEDDDIPEEDVGKCFLTV